MASKKETSGIKADIPSAAVEEALRSVEKLTAEAEIAPAESGTQDDRETSAEVESLRAQVELSQQKGRETLERLKEEHERFLRAAADLENYRKRAHREREEVQRYGIEKLLKDLIPVLDNLERAFKAAVAEDPLAGGVKLVLRSFEETLGRYGVKAFSALGQPFDPQLHEALLEVKSVEPPGTVILEQGRGYLLNERLVRPAMVGIAVAGSDPATSTESVPAESAVGAGKAGDDEGGETGSSQG